MSTSSIVLCLITFETHLNVRYDKCSTIRPEIYLKFYFKIYSPISGSWTNKAPSTIIYRIATFSNTFKIFTICLTFLCNFSTFQFNEQKLLSLSSSLKHKGFGHCHDNWNLLLYKGYYIKRLIPSLNKNLADNYVFSPEYIVFVSGFFTCLLMLVTTF